MSTDEASEIEPPHLNALCSLFFFFFFFFDFQKDITWTKNLVSEIFADKNLISSFFGALIVRIAMAVLMSGQQSSR